MTLLQKMYDTYLRPLNPEWRLPAGSGRRLALVNAFPLIILAAVITQVVLSYVFSRAELFYCPDDAEGCGPLEVWQRLFRLASAVQILLGVSVGALFLVGVRGLRRAEGSWDACIRNRTCYHRSDFRNRSDAGNHRNRGRRFDLGRWSPGLGKRL